MRAGSASTSLHLEHDHADGEEEHDPHDGRHEAHVDVVLVQAPAPGQHATQRRGRHRQRQTLADVAQHRRHALHRPNYTWKIAKKNIKIK